MKKFVLLLCLLTIGISSAGRNIHKILFKVDVISVYYDSLAVYEICRLDNTRSHEYLDWWYFVTVDNQTSDMFHISTALEVSQYESCTIEGWVYKKDCCLCMQVDKYDGHGNSWKYLYERPDSDSSIIVEISSDEHFDSIDNGVLDIVEMDLTPGSRWVKISFVYNGTKYIGWTERYITDP